MPAECEVYKYMYFHGFFFFRGSPLWGVAATPRFFAHPPERDGGGCKFPINLIQSRFLFSFWAISLKFSVRKQVTLLYQFFVEEINTAARNFSNRMVVLGTNYFAKKKAGRPKMLASVECEQKSAQSPGKKTVRAGYLKEHFFFF